MLNLCWILISTNWTCEIHQLSAHLVPHLAICRILWLLLRNLVSLLIFKMTPKVRISVTKKRTHGEAAHQIMERKFLREMAKKEATSIARLMMWINTWQSLVVLLRSSSVYRQRVTPHYSTQIRVAAETEHLKTLQEKLRKWRVMIPCPPPIFNREEPLLKKFFPPQLKVQNLSHSNLHNGKIRTSIHLDPRINSHRSSRFLALTLWFSPRLIAVVYRVSIMAGILYPQMLKDLPVKDRDLILRRIRIPLS